MTLNLPLEEMPDATSGRALLRISFSAMQNAGLQAGDIVSVKIRKETYARVMPEGGEQQNARCSVDLAENAGGAIGDTATITRTDLPPLRDVTLKLGQKTARNFDAIRDALSDVPLTLGDKLLVALPLGRKVDVTVVALSPSTGGLVQSSTLLSITPSAVSQNEFETIGGLEDQIARLQEIVALPLQRPDLFTHLGISPPRGVLFTGPPGSGKTLLARTIASKTSAAFFQISGPEIVSKHYGESEASLRRLFESAQKQAPAIIFIDEIDAIAPRRDALSGEKQVERRVVAQLLTLLDGLEERDRVIVMSATNLPDSLDPALRRPGRFDREIPFSPPNATQRTAILNVHLRDVPLGSEVDLTNIAADCHGYVGADLAALAREASLAAMERVLSKTDTPQTIELDALFIEQCDLLHGRRVTSPSILRDTVVETPNVGFADIGGLDAVKAQLREAIIWPQKHKEMFSKLNVAGTPGVLLNGPPGSGKTLLARALATESGMNFIPVRPGRIMSQFLGEAERGISEIFAKARQSSPCLIFFDELDALAPCRTGKDATLDRIVAQILSELDGLVRNEGVTVLAATNRAAAIDPALTRPGRFDTVIAIDPPDLASRLRILEIHSQNLPTAQDVQMDILAGQTEGVSGADLAAIVRSAARSSLSRAIADGSSDAVVSQNDFTSAISRLQVSEGVRKSDFIRDGAC